MTTSAQQIPDYPALLAHGCTDCGAKPDDRCTARSSGFTIAVPHFARFRSESERLLSARAAGEKSAAVRTPGAT